MNLRGIAVLAAALGLGSVAHADSGAGTTSFEFLRLPVGARQTGMGGAGVAVADDLTGSLLNPAALGRLWRREAVFGYSAWQEDVQYRYAGYGQPTLSAGNFGATIFDLDYGTINGYAASGAPASNPTASDRAFTLGYGRAFGDDLWLGADARLAQESLAGRQASAYNADLGVIYHLPFHGRLEPSHVGLAIRNIGAGGHFDQAASILPLTVQAGLAYPLYFDGVSLAADVTDVKGEGLAGRFGVECWLRDVLALRLGYNTSASVGDGLSFGFGAVTHLITFDYSFTSFGGLGDTHHVGMTMRFGSIAEDHYERGLEAMRSEDYLRAIMEFKETLKSDPKNTRAILAIREAGERLQEQK